MKAKLLDKFTDLVIFFAVLSTANAVALFFAQVFHH